MAFNLLKDPSQLQDSDIVAYLNSGKYISSMTRKMLEEKIGKEKQVNSYPEMKTNIYLTPNERTNFFTSSRKNELSSLNKGKMSEQDKRSETLKNTKVEFPALAPTENASIIVPENDDKPLINYNSLVKNSEQIQRISNNKMFVGNELILQFKHIQDMYNDYAIHRIRLQYLILNRKIHIIDAINYINFKKGAELKRIFDYPKWVREEMELKKCLNMYLILTQLIHFLKVLSVLLSECQLRLDNDLPIECDHVHKVVMDTKMECNDITIIPKIINENLGEYRTEIMECLKLIRDTVNNINKMNKDKMPIILTEISTKRSDLQNIINDVIIAYDPHIECDYRVSININRENPIIHNGLGTFIYLSCNEKIDLSLKTKYINDTLLKTMNEKKLRKMFSKSKIGNCDNIIQIQLSDPYKKINISYDINNLEVPFAKSTIKIVDLPPESYIFSTVLRNPSLDRKMYLSSHVQGPVISDFWLHSKRLNNSRILSKEEYNNLDPQLTQAYSLGDTNKNIFHVDFLFDMLLKADKENTYIKPDMLQSFETLAKDTSTFA